MTTPVEEWPFGDYVETHNGGQGTRAHVFHMGGTAWWVAVERDVEEMVHAIHMVPHDQTRAHEEMTAIAAEAAVLFGALTRWPSSDDVDAVFSPRNRAKA
jgi:hypothetical protein